MDYLNWDVGRDSLCENDAGTGPVAELMEMPRTAKPVPLHQILDEAMTIKETSFFRDSVPFELLRDKLLPELIRSNAEQRKLWLWSAACSTGQETYSLAMLLLEHFPQLADWDVTIVGTDISQVACETARRGCYSKLEVLRGLPIGLLLRYFEPDGEEWKVRDKLRRIVRFERANLCEPLPAGLRTGWTKFDVVLLRNVLLYFAAEERARVLLEVHARMQPKGALLLGTAEQAEDSTDLFRVELDRGCYFYRTVVMG
jgi:chemotaxis protein methyltransferase CheR